MHFVCIRNATIVIVADKIYMKIIFEGLVMNNYENIIILSMMQIFSVSHTIYLSIYLCLLLCIADAYYNIITRNYVNHEFVFHYDAVITIDWYK